MLGKGITRRLFILFVLASSLMWCASICEAQIRVACVGDSITYGYGLADPATEAYPAQLQQLLGSGYDVNNYGVNGVTALKGTNKTYWRTSQYSNSKSFNPNIVVIMLGTNDSKPTNWDAALFNADYKDLIASYRALSSQPTVYVCLPPPFFLPSPFSQVFNHDFIQNTLVPAVQQIANETGCPTIDNNTCFLDHPELFTDGCHPNAVGAQLVAVNVETAIAGGGPPPPPPVTTDMYVNSITMTKGSSGRNWYARATIQVKDETGASVSGATVSISWSGAVSGTSSGTTAADGTVTLQSASKRSGGTFTATVTGVTAAGYAYSPTLNVVTAASITAP